MPEIISITPIGQIRSPFNERYLAPLQAEMDNEQRSFIELAAHCNYETALRDLEGFSHIWVIWWFHEAQSWKPVIQTPRDGTKHGVFATRSPHRPNPVAISAVRLHGIKGRVLEISGADMLDGTPVLDIKPYISQHDSFPDATEGWTNSPSWKARYSLDWTAAAEERASLINELCSYNMRELVERRLLLNPRPTSSNRIEQLDELTYILASRAWRVTYRLEDDAVSVETIHSAYTTDRIHLAAIELNPQEAAAHRRFLELFSD